MSGRSTRAREGSSRDRLRARGLEDDRPSDLPHAALPGQSDALAVHKDADGDIEVAHLSNLSKDEAIELGSMVGALIGLGIDGEDGMQAGAEVGAEQAAENGINVFNDDQAWDVLEDLPDDS